MKSARTKARKQASARSSKSGQAKPAARSKAPVTARTAKLAVAAKGAKVAAKASDRKSTRLNSSHVKRSRMPSSA